LDLRFQDLEIRRAFTVFQFMTILEEPSHSFKWVRGEVAQLWVKEGG